MSGDHVDLFGAPAAEPKVKAPIERPQWSAYAAQTRRQCDDCIVEAHTAGGSTVRGARWKRVAAGVTTLLCSPHAQTRRAEDKLPELKEPKGRPAR